MITAAKTVLVPACYQSGPPAPGDSALTGHCGLRPPLSHGISSDPPYNAVSQAGSESNRGPRGWKVAVPSHGLALMPGSATLSDHRNFLVLSEPHFLHLQNG